MRSAVAARVFEVGAKRVVRSDPERRRPHPPNGVRAIYLVGVRRDRTLAFFSFHFSFLPPAPSPCPFEYVGPSVRLGSGGGNIENKTIIPKKPSTARDVAESR